MPTIWLISSRRLDPSVMSQCGGFEVEIGVWPPQVGRRVGVHWSAGQGWQPSFWNDARFIRTQPNAFGGQDEVWTASMSWTSMSTACFYFALFGIDRDGTMVWANNNGWNYAEKCMPGARC